MSSASERTDPRITRTITALQRAAVELASQRPVSRITVAELAGRAGVTRATFYNRYSAPLDPLVEALYADLETGHRLEDRRRAEGYPGPELLRLAVAEVADHVERFAGVYRHALDDPADRGVYDALVRHFNDYALTFLARATGAGLPAPGLPGADQQVIAQFLAHGFTGAIKAWLSDPSITKDDLVDAAVACAPAWWAAAGASAPPKTVDQGRR
ncbi:TetR/AcrR family transcriptional regulator [Streptomyces sp. PSKA30]|uniref:TetR/AcrR family transcriptional regulator n=1 Tax=Streptomyces sp. PSKA30 TaxID=2874597 RepID=UPI001CD11A30|nr:TetR/AcrR family transcriptional regulator [Streptomyces sp. PSKA30]MBZ9639973.1 TetR/AcrR family transcriptional regulator [Streptomyces sp. PSKA30]